MVERTKILIVEDEVMTGHAVKDQVVEAGYDVIELVTSGEEAIQQAAALQPDLVLMDVKLKWGMDGINAAHTIHQTFNIPIIYLISNDDDEALLQQSQVSRPCDCLFKPFGNRELHNTIQMALYHHQTEMKLRENEMRLAAFISAIPDLVFILDKNGAIIELVPQQSNPLYPEIRKLNTQGQIFLPEAAATITATVEKTFQTNTSQIVEYPLQLAAGLHWFEGRITPLPSVIGQAKRVILLARDITQRKHDEVSLKISQDRLEQEAEKRTYALREIITHLKIAYAERVEAENALNEAHQHLKELDQLKDNFMSGISHELRTPLANLKIYQHLINVNPDKSTEYLGAIQQSTKRLETIVEQMLYVTRMYRELDTLADVPIDLNQLVEKVLPEHMPAIKRRNLHLSIEAQPGIPHISGDPNLLARVLHNLLDNTVSYISEGGNIIICTATGQFANNDRIDLSISNTGPEIPPEELPLIFDRFYRGQAALQFGVPGSGLGLYVAQMIVERHDGQIEVRNGAINGDAGITFTISFPCR